MSPLEITLGYEQVAIEVTASIAQHEPDPYRKTPQSRHWRGDTKLMNSRYMLNASYPSRGFALCACMLEFGVDFTAHQNDKSADVHPGQQHDDGADTAVGLVV
jgi:hypothetical protein